MKIIRLISSLLVLVALSSCGTSSPALDDYQLYDNAVKDAVFAEESEIKHLVELTKEDENVLWNDKNQVLMCSFHHYPTSYIEGETITTSWESWVVSVKEFSNWYKQNKGSFTDYTMRTRQLMAVDPDKPHTHISAFYLNPSELFRPAYMPDVTKQISELSLPLGANPDFVSWFEEQTYYSYFTAKPKLPWTRLGYTYDWAANSDKYGLSEFVLPSGFDITTVKTAEVNEFYTYLESI